MNSITIQIFTNQQWEDAGKLELYNQNEVAKGYRGKSSFEYYPEYAEKYFGDRNHHAVSVTLPVNFDFHNFNSWPAFALDLLPSGAARRYWLQRLGLQNIPASDWQLLSYGAGNPVGNLRVKSAADNLQKSKHQGFDLADIIHHKDNFMDYAYQHGAPVAGSSGAQGDAPKFLLVEDVNSKWHADTAISDEQVKKHWLVKFARGRKEIDQVILKTEAIYLKIAKQLGFIVSEIPVYKDSALFIPRFDRVNKNNQIFRFGMESFYSAGMISDFGVPMHMEDMSEIILQYSELPTEDLAEFILRDLLNFIFLNTDNHGRNTALLKSSETGKVHLSPLFDLAPMALDPEIIVRMSKWKQFESAIPDWKKIAGFYDQKLSTNLISKRLANLYKQIKQIPVLLETEQADDLIIEQVTNKINSLYEN